MAAPELSVVKAWCRIDGSEFDAILPMMIADATARASHETGHDYMVEDMPGSVQMWCVAQIADWLKTPEASVDSPTKKNLFLDGLLDPYRKYAMEVITP